MRRLLFTLFCLTSLLLNAGSIWEEGSQWDVYYTYDVSAGIEDSTDVVVWKFTYRLLPADDDYMALEQTVTKDDEVIFTEVQGYIRNDNDRVIYVRPVLEDGSIGDECLLYDFSEPYEYGGTVRYGVIGGEVKEEFIDWQEDSLDYYMMNNGDTHCLPAWKGIIYKYGYIGGPMDLFLKQATPGQTKHPKPSNVSHVIFSTKGGHKTSCMNWYDDEEDDIIIPYDEMLADGTTWECLAVTNRQYDPNNTYTIQVKGDTLIGERRCKQIYSPEYNIQKTLFEEGRKVYLVVADNHPEVVLDFNLQEGDILDDVACVVWEWDQENQSYHYRTITIDTGIDCQPYFPFDQAPWYYHLIEGIGVSKDEFLEHRFLGKDNTFSYLLKCRKEGTLVYQAAQEYEYIPFVREGVKWVYYYNNDFARGVLDMPEGIQYYSFEMGGDVLIGDKYYKPVILTHYFDNEGKEKEVEDFIPVYLREEDKVVYAIHPDGILHPQCPAGIYQCINYPDHGLPITTKNEEFVLYDFNEPKGFYDTFFEEVNTFCESEGFGPFVEYLRTDMVPLGNQQSKCHYFNCLYSAENKIIEGVGYDGYVGMPLFYFERLITGLQVQYYLSHVLENGEIIYRGIHYNPDVHVGIDEVVADQTRRPLDSNYYTLMGQPVGKDVPTTPGIYIYQGKKIVIR